MHPKLKYNKDWLAAKLRILGLGRHRRSDIIDDSKDEPGNLKDEDVKNDYTEIIVMAMKPWFWRRF